MKEPFDQLLESAERYLGLQFEIAAQIRERGDDYILSDECKAQVESLERAKADAKAALDSYIDARIHNSSTPAAPVA